MIDSEEPAKRLLSSDFVMAQSAIMEVNMKKSGYNKSLSLTDIKVTDHFFNKLMETIRTEVIPYQWEALNDRVAGAAPSFCMRNFRVAGRLGEKRREYGQDLMPTFPTDIFNLVPDTMDRLEDRFYGFVFQDTDFSKWIEAVGYSLAQKPDPELQKLADEAIDLVCAAQYEDGYLDTFYIINNPKKRFTNLKDHHELYCLGHLIEGAIAYYQGTGKDKLLLAAMRFADCVAEHFGPVEGKCKGYPGHEIAEMALVKLYEVTGIERYLRLAKFFIDQRGNKPYYFTLEHHGIPEGKDSPENYHYYQAHKPVREQEDAVGHAVRAVYLYSGMADVAKHTGDEELFHACERLWNSIEQKKLYITGGIGASPDGEAFSYDYNLPNDKMYNETCASIGLIFFARRMLELSPEARYADVMERALYNGVISGMALDGRSFFYVNPLEVEPEGCRKDTQRKQVALPRQKWFGCACCPPNLARLLSSVASYAYGENETTLFLHLYVGGKITKKVGGHSVLLEVESEYPWKDTIRITLDMEQSTRFTMAVRLPEWCQNSRIIVNDEETSLLVKEGYAYLDRIWSRGDVIVLVFPMEPVFCQVNTRVRADVGQVALMRGPVVYCLEEADNGADLHLVEVNVSGPVRLHRENGQLGDIIRLNAMGRKILSDRENGLYRPFSGYEYEEISLKYIPYYTWCNRGVGEMRVYTGWYSDKSGMEAE